MTILDEAAVSVKEAMETVEELQVYRHLVYILTRTWSGERIGAGDATDTKAQIDPNPYLKSYDHDLRIREGGNIKQGDVLAKFIPKEVYANESEVDCSTSEANVEKFYYMNDRLYQVISVLDGYVYWNIHLRKSSKQDTYF